MSTLSSGSRVSIGSKNLVLSSELGRGGFGVVYKAIDHQSGHVFALKVIQSQDDEERDMVVREINSLVRAKHENIVQIMGVDTCVISSRVHFLLLTEFCSGGNLNSRLDRPSSYEREMQWLEQLSGALEYLHSCNPPIVHRDLKAENVLLVDSVGENLKLADFGLAREYGKRDRGSINPHGVSYMTSQVGTPYWMAPEVYSSHYTEKADIFSLGVMFYAILARHSIQVGSKRLYGVFVNIPGRGAIGIGKAMLVLNQRLEVPFSSSFRGCKIMRNLIQAMLEQDYKLRPTAGQVYQTVYHVCSLSSR